VIWFAANKIVWIVAGIRPRAEYDLLSVINQWSPFNGTRIEFDREDNEQRKTKVNIQNITREREKKNTDYEWSRWCLDSFFDFFDFDECRRCFRFDFFEWDFDSDELLLVLSDRLQKSK